MKYDVFMSALVMVITAQSQSAAITMSVPTRLFRRNKFREVRKFKEFSEISD